MAFAGCRCSGAYSVLILTLVVAMLVSESLERAATPAPPPRHPSRQPRVRHPHPSRHPPTAWHAIQRPDECKIDTIFSDCFLCGKIADELLIYQNCCAREPDTVDFCTRLLI